MIYEKNQWFSNFKYMYKDFAYFSFAKRKKWNSSVKLLYSCVEKLLFFRKIDFYVKLTVYLFISRRNVNAAKKYYETRSRKKKKKKKKNSCNQLFSKSVDFTGKCWLSRFLQQHFEIADFHLRKLSWNRLFF